MKRREFIAGLLVAASLRPARAQQATKTYRLALVHPSNPIADMSETSTRAFYRSFFKELRQLGYVEGKNLIIERYSGAGWTEHFYELTRDVVRHQPDVIFASSSRLVREFKEATNTIPIVASTDDPVVGGLVASLARPGGNITGVSVDAGIEIWGKRLGLLMEAIPHLSRVGFLASRGALEAAVGAAMREAAQRRGVALVAPPLDGPFVEAEYRRVFATMVQERADGLIVNDQVEHATNRRLIAELAEENRLPAIYAYREQVEAGGLMAYAIDLSALYRHAAEHIDLILKGAKPGEIPYYQATKFELIINVKAARAIGLSIPPSLLLRADEVIE
jgi:putative ABC transport system substrate-binding protein